MNRKINLIIFSFFSIITFPSTVLKAQEVRTTSSYGCAGNQSEVVCFITGVAGCSPVVGSTSSWSVNPSAGVSILYTQTSTNPISYANIRVKFTNPGTYRVSASFTCSLGSGSATSVPFTVYQSGLIPTISISANTTTFCNQPITFQSSSTNAGSAPTYQWKINGITVPGQNATSFTPSVSALKTGDVVSATLYSAMACNSQLASSNTITVTKKSFTASPATQSLQFCDFEVSKLSAPLTSLQSSFNWYTSAGSLIGNGSTFPLGVLKEGTYQYQAQVVDVYGCLGDTRTTINLSVSSSCDAKLNWIESISFDNASEVGHSKSYFDQSGRLLQSQGKNFTRNQILTSQSIKDQYGRDVVGTLGAPLNKPSFQYKHWFVTDQSGGLYDYSDFGQGFGNSEPGTVGWYYSANNTIEDHAPVTAYPYSQTEYYTDGTGEVRKSAGPGEAHRLGGGHETMVGTFPVFSELNDYLIQRTVVMPAIVQDGSLVNEGVQTISRDQNGKRGLNENFSIGITDKEGKVVVTARSGTSTDNVLAVANSIVASADVASTNFRPLVYFYLLTPQAVSITGNGAIYKIENIITGQVFTPSGNWPVGFYRVLVSSGLVTINYTNYYLDVAYQFYDDAGRLSSSISPNGFKQLKAMVPYANIDKTTYKYNFRGWLLEMTEPDAGTSKYLYRKDGKIRYSQNAQQLLNETNSPGKGRFSYTNYDYLGRPVESGEYNGSAQTFATVKMSVEFANQITFALADKKDWVKTYYQTAYTGTLDLPTGVGTEWKSQDFLRGAVSWTENANMQSVYSYDELGRVKWMAQKSPHLDRTFVVRYEYDFLGNVLKVHNLAYQKSGSTVKLAEQFYHHYDYDLDKRLSKAYTSPEGSTKRLRASYEYYLHGPLKRIELGDQLQGIDFVYNINGWLESINHPDTNQDPGGDGNAGTHSGFKKDVFGMVLDYYKSELSGLFTVGASGSTHDPSTIHQLPSLLQNAHAFHQPLTRFAPFGEYNFSLPFKQYSAENPRYTEVISEASKNSTNR
jgi:hypothetical protein